MPPYRLASSREFDSAPPFRFEWNGSPWVAFRDEQGKPVAIHAVCRHMGAHLGHGGTIEKGAVRCPFHSWKYASNGTLVECPHSRREQVPKVKLQTLELDENDHHIWIINDSVSSTDRLLDQQPPCVRQAVYPSGWFQVGWLSELKKRGNHGTLRFFGEDLSYRIGAPNTLQVYREGGQISLPVSIQQDACLIWYASDQKPPAYPLPDFLDFQWRILSATKALWGNISDMAENIVDLKHFVSVHGSKKTTFELFELKDHRANVTLNLVNQINRVSIPGVVAINQYGPGVFWIKTRSLGIEYRNLVSTTPIDRTSAMAFYSFAIQRSDHAWFDQMRLRIFKYIQLKFVQQDVAIWKHKANLEKPIFLNDETELYRYRKWFESFY